MANQRSLPVFSNLLFLNITYDDYLDNLTLKFHKSGEIARNSITESKETNKKYYDEKENDAIFSVDQLVYLLNRKSRKGHSKKLTPQYSGPYKILEVNLPVNCTVLIRKILTKVHMNRLKHAFVSGLL